MAALVSMKKIVSDLRKMKILFFDLRKMKILFLVCENFGAWVGLKELMDSQQSRQSGEVVPGIGNAVH